MEHADTGIRQKLQDKIPIGHRIHTVAADQREIEQLRHVMPVDWVGGPGQGSCPQGHHVDPGQAIRQAPGIPGEHFIISHQMMAEKHRLSPLHVGVAGHDRIYMFPGKQDELFTQPGQTPDKVGGFLAQVHAYVQGHLVVPTPGSMQLLGDLAHFLEQAGFDMHVNIFKAVIVSQRPAFNSP